MKAFAILILSLIFCPLSLQGQEASRQRIPVFVSHLSSENKALLRRKAAPKHNIISRVICFKRPCRAYIGWRSKQRSARFKGYKTGGKLPPRRISPPPISPPPISPPSHQASPPLVGTDSLTVSAGPSREEGVEIASDEQILILDDVFFELNSAHLNEAFTFRLDSLVALLLAHENLTVSISGHTDNKGDETYNLSLSRARAEAVALYLRKNKIRESRISFQGEGSARPRASNNTAAGRKKNRRVEIRISNQ